jgi:hypothetical protein
MRLMFVKSNKMIFKKYPPKEVLSDYSILLSEKLFKLNLYLSHYENDKEIGHLISRSFIPSKTAQNGLNFITKENEIHLIDYEQVASTVEESFKDVLDMFKFIYILLHQRYDKVDQKMLISNLINKILPKIKIENLSKNCVFILKIINFRKFIFERPMP